MGNGATSGRAVIFYFIYTFPMPRSLPTGVYVLLLLILIAANVSIYRMVFAPQMLEVRVLDVGKGDATLVRAPNGATILIDTGPDASILRALGTALPPWQRKIDAVILTSTKKSAVGGLPDVFRRYTVGQQVSIAESTHLAFSEGASIDIMVSPNATTTVVAR